MFGDVFGDAFVAPPSYVGIVAPIAWLCALFIVARLGSAPTVDVAVGVGRRGGSRATGGESRAADGERQRDADDARRSEAVVSVSCA